MNAERFEWLVAQLLDGELSSGEADELATALTADATRRRDVRQQLIAWDLWSQQVVAERSAEAFLAAVRTRQRAEQASETFVDEVKDRIAERGSERVASAISLAAGRLLATARRALGACRPLRLAIGSAVAVALVIAVWFWPHQARATVTLEGQAICTACALHETHAHLPAIRVRQGDRTIIYYVSSGRFAVMRLGDYCTAAIPVVVTGAAEVRGRRGTIAVENAQRRASAASPDDRVLFPF